MRSRSLGKHQRKHKYHCNIPRHINLSLASLGEVEAAEVQAERQGALRLSGQRKARIDTTYKPPFKQKLHASADL